MVEPALIEAAGTHGPSFVFAMFLLYELREIRTARQEERENWLQALRNNTEAMRELKNRQPMRADGGEPDDR